jgi:hypothetical protein
VVVAQCGEGQGVAMANIDLEYLHTLRGNMPVQNQRRPDLYGMVEIQKEISMNINSCSIKSKETSVDLPEDDYVFNFGPAKVPGPAIFYRTSQTVAFVNKKPVVEGHFLVSPVREVAKIGDLTSSEVADLFQVVQKVEGFMQRFYKVDGTTISIQSKFKVWI